jgi:hypothetical protein
MSEQQGNLSLLEHPIAQELLNSSIPARLAYTWTDGSPRVIPIFFLWAGGEIVVYSPPTAPKMKALRSGSRVALTIDSNDWPCKVLMIRGETRVEQVEGGAAGYASVGERYIGKENAQAYASQFQVWFPQNYRITIKPDWVALINYEDRFPSAIHKAMAG